jgi:hypothetical protein
MQVGSQHGNQGMSVDQPLLLEPPAGGLGASAGVGGDREAFDQPGDPVGVSGGLGMVDGQLWQAVDLAPGCRPGLELLDQLGLAPPGSRAEQAAEQVVAAVPLALPVQRNAQRIDALQRLQGVAQPPGVRGRHITCGRTA